MKDQAVPTLDVLSGSEHPYTGYGDILPSSHSRNQSLRDLADDVRIRLHEGFGFDKESANPAGELDTILARMWADGWSPQAGNLDLFATDFGLVILGSLSSRFGGNTLFRSETSLDHVSLWWPSKRTEAFPFHRALQSLVASDTESISSYCGRVGSLLARTNELSLKEGD